MSSTRALTQHHLANQASGSFWADSTAWRGLAVGPAEAWFWGALAISLLVGFLAALPYNYYALKKHGKACHAG